MNKVCLNNAVFFQMYVADVLTSDKLIRSFKVQVLWLHFHPDIDFDINVGLAWIITILSLHSRVLPQMIPYYNTKI